MWEPRSAWLLSKTACAHGWRRISCSPRQRRSHDAFLLLHTRFVGLRWRRFSCSMSCPWDKVTCMEDRIGRLESDVAVLKTDVEYMKRDLSEMRTDVRGFRDRQERDFRLLFGAIIFVTLGLTGVLAKSFGWIH